MEVSLPALVLCGGLGTRLRPVVSDLPKALAPVGGTPFLTLQLRHLRSHGVRRVVLSAGYRGDQVEAYAAADPVDGVEVTCVTEPTSLGTAGALRYAAWQAGLDGAFLALNGDTFCDVSIAQLIEAHEATATALATLAVVDVPDASRFGTVVLPDGATPTDAAPVLAFREKQAGTAGWISVGIYVLTPDALGSVAPGHSASLEHDVFPSLRPRLFARPFPGASFLDIGTPDDYARAATVLAPLLAL